MTNSLRSIDINNKLLSYQWVFTLLDRNPPTEILCTRNRTNWTAPLSIATTQQISLPSQIYAAWQSSSIWYTNLLEMQRLVFFRWSQGLLCYIYLLTRLINYAFDNRANYTGASSGKLSVSHHRLRYTIIQSSQFIQHPKFNLLPPRNSRKIYGVF